MKRVLPLLVLAYAVVQRIKARKARPILPVAVGGAETRIRLLPVLTDEDLRIATEFYRSRRRASIEELQTQKAAADRLAYWWSGAVR